MKGLVSVVARESLPEGRRGLQAEVRHDAEELPHRIRVEHEFHGMRLDRFLHARLPWHSRTRIQKLIEAGKVLDVTGNRVKAAKRVSKGMTIVLLRPKPKEEELPEIRLDPLFEDAWLLAIDKPANLAVHPNARALHHTVVSILKRHYDVPIDLVHRLDRETSGVLLLTKDKRVNARLKEDFAARRVEKRYLAITRGELRIGMTIDLPMGPGDFKIRVKQGVFKDAPFAAVTKITIQERFPGYTLVEAIPKTGRQHQIRVHLDAIGHPIVGDKIYGVEEDLFLRYIEGGIEAIRDELEMERHALHAHLLAFEHPILRKRIEITAPLPPDMKDFLDKLRKKGKIHQEIGQNLDG
ncbi:MAG: RluA family pseudouridine synthase [Deltaproteobacteria bacterium]|nr:MAG: RluA family pseudouridine synthase [Deltaproteobacteria bacterium]